jgi:hypothetical protein
VQNNDSHLPAVAEPKTLGRRTLVRGAAWAAPVVGVAAAAPAYAASYSFGVPDFTYTGWEWNNLNFDMVVRGAAACAGNAPIPANTLKITITLPNSLSRGAANCGNVYTKNMTYVTGLGGWGGDTSWSFVETSTGTGKSRQLIWTFTYTQPIAANQCVRLSFDADVDVDNFFCALPITQTPNLSYTVTAGTQYTPQTWPIFHNNNVI